MNKPRYFFLRPIRQAMNNRGLVSQRELAAAAGVSQPTLSRFFKLRRCRETTAAAVCRVLGLNVNKIRDNSADLKQADLFDRRGAA